MGPAGENTHFINSPTQVYFEFFHWNCYVFFKSSVHSYIVFCRRSEVKEHNKFYLLLEKNSSFLFLYRIIPDASNIVLYLY